MKLTMITTERDHNNNQNTT